MDRNIAADGIAQTVLGLWPLLENALEKCGETDALARLRASKDIYAVATEPVSHAAGNIQANAGPPTGPAGPATNIRRDTP